MNATQAYESEINGLVVLFAAVPRSNPRIVGMITPEQAALVRCRTRARAKFHAASQRANKLGVVIALTLDQWLNVLDRSKGVCSYCSNFVGVAALGPDHVVPLSRGGRHALENIVAACSACNYSKGARDVESFIKPKPGPTPKANGAAKKPATKKGGKR
jgi:5-methylcytosine-specific restriction endonuclease McrA